MFNKYVKFLFIFLILITVAGCSIISQEPITAETAGLWNHYIVYPFSLLIIFVANLFNESYGLAIIVVTIFIRLCLMPLIMKQMKNSQAMQAIKPELEKLQQRKDIQDDPQKYYVEMMKLYEKRGVKPFAGFLPFLIQAPILIAFYYAIMRTEEIALDTFLWFDLGSVDPFFILPLVAALTTYLATKFSMSNSGANPQMKMMLYVMPIMILVAAIMMPSALTLYWIIGNIFSIFQSYFLFEKGKLLGL